jgi:hypothetical protein
MSLPAPSPALVAIFALLAVVVASAFPIALHRAERALGRPPSAARRSALRAALAAVAWMALTGGTAAAGLLSFSGTPPTAMLLFPAAGALGVGIGLSDVGRRLAVGVPLAALVGLQAFRFPLELAMHRAAVEGLMPVQMSFAGRNFDILTGLAALALAPLVAARRAPRALVQAWNVAGSLLLLNVVVIAALSTPTPLRSFTNEPANVWVTRPPFVWLPTVLVVTALYGHIVVFRALAAGARRAG